MGEDLGQSEVPYQPTIIDNTDKSPFKPTFLEFLHKRGIQTTYRLNASNATDTETIPEGYKFFVLNISWTLVSAQTTSLNQVWNAYIKLGVKKFYDVADFPIYYSYAFQKVINFSFPLILEEKETITTYTETGNLDSWLLVYGILIKKDAIPYF